MLPPADHPTDSGATVAVLYKEDIEGVIHFNKITNRYNYFPGTNPKGPATFEDEDINILKQLVTLRLLADHMDLPDFNPPPF